jgi:hypothetical protein
VAGPGIWNLRSLGLGSRTPPSSLPEEEAQGAHVAQVHVEHAADLLQGAAPLRLVPALALQEAAAVREAQGSIRAGGGTGRAGHVRSTCFSAMTATRPDWGGHVNKPPSSNKHSDATGHTLQEAVPTDTQE